MEQRVDEHPESGAFDDGEIRRILPRNATYSRPWLSWGTNSAAVGWKIHLSSTPHDFVEMLRRVIPGLVAEGTAFKAAATISDVLNLNCGHYGPTQVGKCVTIYPRDQADTERLVGYIEPLVADLKGPPVITDEHVGGVVYVRYGAIAGGYTRDRFGRKGRVAILGDVAFTDAYSVPFVPPPGVPHLFGTPPPRTDRVSEGTAAAICDGQFAILGVFSPTPGGGVYFGSEVATNTPVVVKHGRRLTEPSMDGSDAYDRVLREARIVQASRTIQALGPVLLGQQANTSDAFAVYRMIAGEAMSVTPPRAAFRELSFRRAFWRSFADLCARLHEVHKEGTFHRDISPNNIIFSDRGLSLIDWEHAFFPSEPRVPSGGTLGYFSERRFREPSYSGPDDDAFAMASVLVHALCGLDPRRLTWSGSTGIHRSIEELGIMPAAVAIQVVRCLVSSPQASLLPLAEAAMAAANETPRAPSVEPATARASRPDAWLAPEELALAAKDVLLLSPQVLPGLWLSPNIDLLRSSRTELKLYRSANRGVSGAVLFAAKAFQAGLVERSDVLASVEAAIDWLVDETSECEDQVLPGLHFGQAGVALALAESVGCGLVEDAGWLQPYMRHALGSSHDWPDLTHGAAGVLVAAMRAHQLVGSDFLTDVSAAAAAYLRSTQQDDGSWVLPDGVPGMTGSTYTGFAHGVAGMVYALATAAVYLGDTTVQAAAQRGARWLRSQIRTGPSPEWTLHTDTTESWRWWCHGAPGIALAFVRVYECFGDPSDLQLAVQCVRPWLAIDNFAKVGSSNLGICHGIGGITEILIEVYRASADPRVLAAAERSAHFCWTMGSSFGGNERSRSWLVEDRQGPVADLMSGSAGLVHSFLRLRQATGSNPVAPFPLLMDIKQ